MKKYSTIAFALIISGLLLSSFNTFAQRGPRKGDVAPDLEYKNPEGKLLKLSDLRGKMVYIDFWASWCFPCRKANPQLVKIYNTFKDTKFKNGEKGFTIYSVSLERPNSMERWKKAIMLDKLIWDNHVSDFKYWSSAPAQKYKVRAIPQGYLLDGKGVIVGKFMHPDDVAYELEKRVKK